MKRFFDVKSEKFLNLDANDVKSHGDGIIKIKSKYYFTCLDMLEDIYYVFDVSKTKSGLSTEIDPENEYFIKFSLNRTIWGDTYGVRKTIPFPENAEMNVGDKCLCGALNNCTILAKDERGYYYIKFFPSDWEVKKHPGIKDKPSYRVAHWSSVNPVVDNPFLIEIKPSNVFYSNQSISGLLSKYFHFGVDMNPEYQRGNVWTEEQKVKLIDSIFNNINIGSFVFVEKKWFTDEHQVASEMFEILDGKQRLTAIIDYVSSKFPYQGKYWHELSPYSRNQFENQGILVGEMKLNRKDKEYNRKQVIEQFIRLNEGGTSMDKAILEKAKKML